MVDILQLRVHPDEFEQLRLCQTKPPSDCHAAFTVSGIVQIWPLASWDEVPVKDRVNVRGWFPLLDQIADEFLIFRPHGGCFFVTRDGARYRVEQSETRGVLFLGLEVQGLALVPPRPARSATGEWKAKHGFARMNTD
jgi:hypothetical protein